MTRDDIIRMAHEANIGTYINLESYLVGNHLERFAELVAAAEREWVGLTEDEICDCIDKTSSLDKGQFLVEFAMSIEDKLKEKNN